MKNCGKCNAGQSENPYKSPKVETSSSCSRWYDQSIVGEKGTYEIRTERSTVGGKP